MEVGWGPLSVTSRLLIVEVGQGPLSVTSRFFNYGGRLGPCVRDVRIKGGPLSLSVDGKMKNEVAQILIFQKAGLPHEDLNISSRRSGVCNSYLMVI